MPTPVTNKTRAYENLILATAGMSQEVVAHLPLAEVYSLIKVTGLTVTFVSNIQQSIVAQKGRQELQDVANEIVTRMKGRFPDIVATPNRNRIIKVWLDGLPEEIE